MSKHHPALRIALLCTLAFACSPLSAAFAEEGRTAQLEIAISGLESDRGVVRVALMNSAEAFDHDTEAFRSADVAVKDGRATLLFEDVPYGAYAVKIYHDENSNGKLDTNFVGFPKEPFGFSNDAMGRFGPPSFEQARFEVAADALRIEIHSK